MTKLSHTYFPEQENGLLGIGKRVSLNCFLMKLKLWYAQVAPEQ